jgi:7-carboxy-7-deazaguanine synthase
MTGQTSYAVKEVFFSLQGEGANCGRPSIFCRFSGCNLWSGREEDRADAVCSFCDTDFRGTDGEGGGRFQGPSGLADHICSFWPDTHSSPFIVFTGGEPSLQLDDTLISVLHERQAQIAIETNGTRPLPDGLDWVCVSPKAGTDLHVVTGNELKLVYPQQGIDPDAYLDLDFSRFFLQPRDGLQFEQNLTACLRYCLGHPRWALSLQTHKFLGIR